MSQQNRVQWVYSSANEKELQERYDQWAKEYDSDLDQEFGWVAPQVASETFAKYVASDAHILDAGAGTGLVGECLAHIGYTHLAAMDLSEGMLAEARSKNVYQAFHQMTMGEPLDFPTDSFDATITVGVLTVGHAPARSIEELVRVTKPGGYIVFSLRPDTYLEAGFKEMQTGLETAGKWKLVEVTDEFKPLPKGEPEVNHQVWVYQVT